MAQRHDAAGYDIRYSPDQGTTWRYVEVKRYTQNCIHLSRNEYNYAAAHRDTYELFLVTADDEIHCLRNIDFNDQEKFDMVASEFIVSFRLDAHDSTPEQALPAHTIVGEQSVPTQEPAMLAH